ncbi:Bromodomain and ATPase domain-containing protein [Salix suchowensis]|nr:Bromodomain and ATPase domain-containing protein [Salix suchowensis]
MASLTSCSSKSTALCSIRGKLIVLWTSNLIKYCYLSNLTVGKSAVPFLPSYWSQQMRLRNGRRFLRPAIPVGGSVHFSPAISSQFRRDQTIGSADIVRLWQPCAVRTLTCHLRTALSSSRAMHHILLGVDSDTAISGNTGSTPIGSLKSALSQIRLSPVTIPALHQTLVQSTSLSFPIDIVETGIASATFTLANPFTASINLLRVGTLVTFHGLTLGKIDNVDISSSPVHADGHSTATSQSLPFNFNLEPSNIIQLLSISSQEQGVTLVLWHRCSSS